MWSVSKDNKEDNTIIKLYAGDTPTIQFNINKVTEEGTEPYELGQGYEVHFSIQDTKTGHVQYHARLNQDLILNLPPSATRNLSGTYYWGLYVKYDGNASAPYNDTLLTGTMIITKRYYKPTAATSKNKLTNIATDLNPWIPLTAEIAAFPGKDGTSVVSVEQTESSTEDNGVNTITITLSNDATYSFQVLNGSKGSEGDSAYEVATNIGFEGTQEEWLETLKGEKGQQGTGITSIQQNQDNTLTIRLSDNTSFNTSPIIGPKGEMGLPGRGIADIRKTSESNGVTVFTVTYTDGTISTLQIDHSIPYLDTVFVSDEEYGNNISSDDSTFEMIDQILGDI